MLVVDADVETQIARVMARDRIDRRQAEKIIRSQSGRDERLGLADDVIQNSGSLTDLDSAVSALHQHYLELSHGLSEREHG